MPSVPRSVQDPLTSSEINIGGTLNVLLAARDAGTRRVVFASSSSVYGDAPGFPRVETQATSPLAPYAVSKLAAEQFCRVAHIVYGLETVALRYFNVFGRRQDPFSQYSAVIPKFIIAMRDGIAPTIYGDGTQSRDFTHIDDVVAANLLAMDAPGAAGEIFNIACGRQVSLNDLVDELNGLLETDIQAGAHRGARRRRQALARRRVACRARAGLRRGRRLRRGTAPHDRGLRLPKSGDTFFMSARCARIARDGARTTAEIRRRRRAGVCRFAARRRAGRSRGRRRRRGQRRVQGRIGSPQRVLHRGRAELDAARDARPDPGHDPVRDAREGRRRSCSACRRR